METINFEIVSAQSNIDWTGKKVTGAHNGTIALKEGTLTLNNGQLSGGNFVIDTTSIKILDITDPDTNAQFAGHLFSADFFATDQFPAASFDITSIDQVKDGDHLITGNLTIKGITHAAGFDATITSSNDSLNLVGKLIVDRTKYDIKFRSGNFFKDLGDTLIYNDFELNVSVTAKAA